MIVNFGKHAGKDVSELPDGYLTWIVEDSHLYVRNRRLFSAAKEELKERNDTPEITYVQLACARMDRYIDWLRKESEVMVEIIVESWYN